MNTPELRIVKDGDHYIIQEPIRTMFGKTGQWKIVGNSDWVAIFGSIDEANKQIRYWSGEDVDKDNVVQYFP